MHHHLHEQEHVWWSRTDPLPVFEHVSAYFADKLRAIDGIMRGETERVTFLDMRQAVDAQSHGALIRCAVIDNDPAVSVSAFFERAKAMSVLPLVVRNGRLLRTGRVPPNQVFLFKVGDAVRLSQWTLKDGRFQNEILDVPAARVTSGKSPHPVRMRLASEWRQFLQNSWVSRTVVRSLHRVRHDLKRMGRT